MKTIITFQSTRAVIGAERTLKRQFFCKIIPVPRQISSECGMALMINPEDREKIARKLEDACIFEISFFEQED